MGNIPTLDESYSHSKGENSNVSLGRGPLPRGFSGGSSVNNSPAMQEMQIGSLGREEPLEKDTASHYSILAWETPQTEEPGRFQSIGLPKSWTRLSDFSVNNSMDPLVQ